MAPTTRGGAKTYNLNDVNVTVDGTIVHGYGDGDAVVIARNSDDYSAQAGSDGEVMFSALNDKSGTITFNLQFGSLLNRVFSDIAAAKRQVAISITEKNGAAQVTVRSAYVQRPPDYTFGREAQVMEWQFICSEILSDFGGLPDETPTP